MKKNECFQHQKRSIILESNFMVFFAAIFSRVDDLFPGKRFEFFYFLLQLAQLCLEIVQKTEIHSQLQIIYFLELKTMVREMVGGCCVCLDERGWDENPLVYCDGSGCNVAVHQGYLDAVFLSWTSLNIDLINHCVQFIYLIKKLDAKTEMAL